MATCNESPATLPVKLPQQTCPRCGRNCVRGAGVAPMFIRWVCPKAGCGFELKTSAPRLIASGAMADERSSQDTSVGDVSAGVAPQAAAGDQPARRRRGRPRKSERLEAKP